MPATDYQERKEQGLCTRCGSPAAEDSALCVPHRDSGRKRAKRSIARIREERRAAGLCPWCPAGVSTTITEPATTCVACRIRRNRWPSRPVAEVDTVVDKSARIAAATSRRNEGRDRYRGQQRRGQRPHAALNAEDVKMAAETFAAFRAGLEVLARPEAKLWRRAERDQVAAATASQGERTQRHIGDVLDRLAARPRGGRCSGDEHAFDPGARACVCGEVAAPDHVTQRHGRRDGER